MTDSKVTPDHLRRVALLYVRQSTLRQVLENQESTQRQYALKNRAQALGWPLDRVVVIDDDLGQSGATSKDREGFQRLVAEVSMGRVGLVMGLEVSRLARNNADWHRLLELCGLTQTLILDEEGLYDPAQFNDRLVLGLKGTMSEAELHILRARLRGAILNKARRGQLRLQAPIGYANDEEGRLVFDPDERVRSAVQHVFDAFRRTRTAYGVVQHFRKENLLFPRRGRDGDVLWAPLGHDGTLKLLHNPRYAGAYVYGQSRTRKDPVTGAQRTRRLPRQEWTVFLPDAHPAYIPWDEYVANQDALRANAAAHDEEHRHGPPRL